MFSRSRLYFAIATGAIVLAVAPSGRAATANSAPPATPTWADMACSGSHHDTSMFSQKAGTVPLWLIRGSWTRPGSSITWYGFMCSEDRVVAAITMRVDYTRDRRMAGVWKAQLRSDAQPLYRGTLSDFLGRDLDGATTTFVLSSSASPCRVKLLVNGAYHSGVALGNGRTMAGGYLRFSALSSTACSPPFDAPDLTMRVHIGAVTVT